MGQVTSGRGHRRVLSQLPTDHTHLYTDRTGNYNGISPAAVARLHVITRMAYNLATEILCKTTHTFLYTKHIHSYWLHSS